MVQISDRKIAIVRTLVETAPDRIVDGLQRALSESGGDSVLAKVRQLVDAEAEDRLLRNAVFQPVTPLFVGDGCHAHSLTFPARAQSLLWRGLKAQAPDQVAAAIKASASIAVAVANEQRPTDPTEAFDALLTTAAGALRASDHRDLRTAAALCDAARPGGAEVLAACLDIAHQVRRTLPRLSDWVARPGEETGAAARLAYKDTVAVAEDAGPRFFEMLAGQLTPPWMVLRIISSIMDKPTERYLSESELGGFPERVMAAIDEALTAIGNLDLDGGPQAGRVAGQRVELITQQIFELEVCIELTRESGWGKRIFGQKKTLAGLAEARLRDVEKLVGEALPTESSAMRRPRKNGPKLDVSPDPKATVRAITALTFAHEIRLCANYGGFSAAHSKAVEKLLSMISGYVDEVLDHLRTGDVLDVAIAHAYLMVAADAVTLVQDEKAGDLIRRRAATACKPSDNTITLDA